MSPMVAVSAVVLFLRPTIFVDIEKKLSAEMGVKKLSRKATPLLERENMVLQQLLIQYNRMAGLLIFVLSVIIIVRLYLPR